VKQKCVRFEETFVYHLFEDIKQLDRDGNELKNLKKKEVMITELQ
jgi:hypothetical protein